MCVCLRAVPRVDGGIEKLSPPPPPPTHPHASTAAPTISVSGASGTRDPWPADALWPWKYCDLPVWLRLLISSWLVATSCCLFACHDTGLIATRTVSADASNNIASNSNNTVMSLLIRTEIVGLLCISMMWIKHTYEIIVETRYSIMETITIRNTSRVIKTHLEFLYWLWISK